MADEVDELRVESLYGARTDAPLVKLIAGSHEWIMPPEKARQIAQWLVEAAEAAYSDAFVVRWTRQRLLEDGESPERALRLAVPFVAEFRTFRELQRRAGREHEEADQEEWDHGHADL